MGSYPTTADFSPEPDAFDTGLPSAFEQRRWLHALLLLLTLATTTVVGGRYALDFALNQPPFTGDYIDGLAEVLFSPARLAAGLSFSLTLLTILMAHELGHYLACVHYGVDASWPYFLPVPTPIGTMGAFIRIRAPIYSKAALFDIGIAGPLAGFLMLLPALAIGLAYSKVIPGIAGEGYLVFGTPLLQQAFSGLIFPGTPISDIYLHPMARAAWVGLLATALNLLPIGQLDGGHILYAFAGDWHRRLSRIFAGLLLAMGLVLWHEADHVSWIVWAVLLLVFGMRHPSIHDWRSPGRGRAALAILALVIFITSFSLIPLSMAGGGE